VTGRVNGLFVAVPQIEHNSTSNGRIPTNPLTSWRD
jgi:hypothetical protein